jgi:hypothetical protein
MGGVPLDLAAADVSERARLENLALAWSHVANKSEAPPAALGIVGSGSINVASSSLAAEVGCTDGFARARLSSRTSALETDIEEYIVEHERRSRENKRSFLSNLLKKHFPIRPKPRRPRK